MNSRHDIASTEATLNELIISGKALEGFELLYHDQVVMQENTAEATVGKVANRERERRFYAAVSESRARLLGSAVWETVSYS